jgi:tetratricopeptide (TPR) repeat protein
MEQKELKFTIQLTKKDFLNFQWSHSGFLRSRKWLILLFVFIVAPYILIEGFSLTSFSVISFSLFIPFLVLAGLFLLVYFLTIYRSKAAFKNDSFINQPYDLIINDDGMSIQAYRSNTDPGWDDIYRYLVNKHGVYIYISDLKAILIPARYLTIEDKASLLEILKARVDTSRYAQQKKKNTSLRIIYYVVILGIVLFIVFKDCGSDHKASEARQLKQTENYAGAKKIYSELIASDPDNPDYYLERADCEIRLMESGFAVLDCEKAIHLDPHSGKAYYYYAFALYNNQQYDAACEAVTRSIKLGYTSNRANLCDITDTEIDSLYARDN